MNYSPKNGLKSWISENFDSTIKIRFEPQKNQMIITEKDDDTHKEI